MPDTRPVPEITTVDAVFGKIDHMPRYSEVEDRFKRNGEPHVDFIDKWFFEGISQTDIDAVCARPGVDKGKALAAVRSVLCSFEPKHEHKTAGCAQLMHDWFILPSQERT